MASIQEAEGPECPIEPRPDPELEREARKKLGIVSPALPYYTSVPWVARFTMFNRNDAVLVHTGLELNDLIFLAVSQDNSCHFCYSAQRSFLRLLGYPEDRIQRLEQDFFTGELEDHERRSIDFAKRISRANPLPSHADLKLLREAGFAEEELKELSFMAAYAVCANRVTTFPALPLELIEGFTNRWWVRLLGPLLGRLLRTQRKSGVREFLSPEHKTGPYSYLVVALDGLPVAGVLRELVDAAWTSRVLAPRTKALVFAIVARGVGSLRAEREAIRLLAEQGLAGDQIEVILSHLSSPLLDPAENAMLPLARESIRYDHTQIQRQALEVSKKLTQEQFVELIGVIGLANMLCRLELICGPE